MKTCYRNFQEPHERRIVDFFGRKERKRVVVQRDRKVRLGAKANALLIVNFIDEGTLKSVLKIQRHESAEREYRQINGVAKFYFKDANGIGVSAKYEALDENGRVAEYSGLLYPYAGKTELNERLYDDRLPVKCLGAIISRLYEDLCGTAHAVRLSKPERIVIGRAYAWYLRGRAPKINIAKWLGADVSVRPTVKVGNRCFPNPLRFMERLSKRNIWCKLGVVHGDLHPKNVILDDYNVPHLIDFAWTRSRLPLNIDYVLLENSIRFFGSTGPIKSTNRYRADALLLNKRGYRALLSWKKNADNRHFIRMAHLVKMVREKAFGVLSPCDKCAPRHKRSCFCEYLIAQFIVLYGLMKFPEYVGHDNMVTLGLLAAKLKRLGY